MEDPRALLEATAQTPELKLTLIAAFDKLMAAVLQDRQDLSDEQRAAIGVTGARAIAEIASSGERNPDRIYDYALARTWAASSGLQWRT